MKKANWLIRTLLIYFLSIGFTAFLSVQAYGQVIKITINQLRHGTLGGCQESGSFHTPITDGVKNQDRA